MQQSSTRPRSQTERINEALSGDGEEDAYAYAALPKRNNCCKVSSRNTREDKGNSKVKNSLSLASIDMRFPEAIMMIAS